MDPKQNPVDDNLETKQPEVSKEPDWKLIAESLEKEKADLKRKNDELIGEKRRVQEREEAAKREAQENAQKNGEFEKLWKTVAEEKEQLANQVNQIKQQYKQEKIDVTAARIANSLADGNDADLLKEFVKKSLDGLADEHGGVGDNIVQDLTNQFKNDEKYKSLLRGSKAAGGGATGNIKGNAQVVEKSQHDFNKLSPVQKHEFLSKGGKVTL